MHTTFFLVREWQKSSSSEEYHIKVLQRSPYNTPNSQAAVPPFSRNSLGKVNVFFHKISAFQIVFSVKKLSVFSTNVWNRFKVTFFSSVLL